MELVKVKLSFTEPRTDNPVTRERETYVAVYPDFETRILDTACELAIKRVISDDPNDWPIWQVTVDYAERMGSVHVEPIDISDSEEKIDADGVDRHGPWDERDAGV